MLHRFQQGRLIRRYFANHKPLLGTRFYQEDDNKIVEVTGTTVRAWFQANLMSDVYFAWFTLIGQLTIVDVNGG